MTKKKQSEPTIPVTESHDVTPEDLADSILAAVESANDEGRDIEANVSRSRRSSPATTEPARIVWSGEELLPLFCGLDSWLSAKMNVEPRPVESMREVANAAAPVMTKYFGETISEYGPEIALLGVGLKVYAPVAFEYNRKRAANKPVEIHTPAVTIDASGEPRRNAVP